MKNAVPGENRDGVWAGCRVWGKDLPENSLAKMQCHYQGESVEQNMGEKKRSFFGFRLSEPCFGGIIPGRNFI